MAKPTGRPSKYSEELAAQILAQIATRNCGLERICEENKGFPVPSTVYLWLLQNQTFSEKYARAKEDQMQVLEDEILHIADNTQLGAIVTTKGDGTEERKLADMIEHRKLRIESRKWLMGKLKPKKYGDKLEVKHDGEIAHRVISDL